MKDFEKTLLRLGEIISDIESGASLTDALELYKEGVALAADCAAVLNDFEKEIMVIEGDGGNGGLSS